MENKFVSERKDCVIKEKNTPIPVKITNIGTFMDNRQNLWFF
ncbi:MAG TPA: hypothetical protein VFY55_08850 [Nitrososphaeraceae archaeon]|nr:hypothetical protein [Nitrososphaeraceae archaeon]